MDMLQIKSKSECIYDAVSLGEVMLRLERRFQTVVRGRGSVPV